jgi:HK97 gp10 family phage protein
MADGLDVSGLNQLAIEVGTLPARGLAAARVALAKTAADIEADAKSFVPVDTGNLRASISRTVSGLVAEIGPTAAYGAYVEFGTSRQGPAAYMGPAFDRRAGGLEQALAQIVGG